MDRYAAAVFLFSALANGALLLGTGYLCRQPPKIWRWMLGTVALGLYAAVCLIDGLSHLNKILFRIPFMVLIGWLSFGRSAKRITVYFLLSFALEGLVATAGGRKAWVAVPSAVLLLWLCAILFRDSASAGLLVPVELQFAGKCIRLTALKDTGNLLYDPITGSPVLIVGLRVSQELTGLSKQQLQQPVEVMRQPPIPGMRLIPYKTISQSSGLVLGVQLSAVRVGDWKGRLVVAFAPEEFGTRGEFEALTGGTV